MPRIRDFRGVSPRGFDGRGNYTMGVREQIIFRRSSTTQIDQVRGMDITITTTARDNKQGRGIVGSIQLPIPKVNQGGNGMAKTSMVEREKRRAGVVKKYASKRAQLKEIIRSPKSTPEQRAAAQVSLQQQPRDASASRGIAIAARLPAVHAAYIASSAWHGPRSARLLCAVEIPGLGKASW